MPQVHHKIDPSLCHMPALLTAATTTTGVSCHYIIHNHCCKALSRWLKPQKQPVCIYEFCSNTRCPSPDAILLYILLVSTAQVVGWIQSYQQPHHVIASSIRIHCQAACHLFHAIIQDTSINSKDRWLVRDELSAPSNQKKATTQRTASTNRSP